MLKLTDVLRPRRLKAAAIAVGLLTGGSILAYAAGYFPLFPIVGNPSYCGSIVGNSNLQGGVTGQGAGTVAGGGSSCAQTIAAGPSVLTGNELGLVDTELPSGQVPQTVSVPTGMFLGGMSLANNGNALVGSDFGQNLWQRGTTPISATTPVTAALSADGWYVVETGAGPYESITVSKQTGAADLPVNSLASARIQRVASQTGTAPVCFGQLVPDADSQAFIGRTAIFSVDLLEGALFSPTNSAVNMVIAYHSAADATTEAANGQGTNTATFASSVAGTQNIANYTEAVNTAVQMSTTWGRYSVAAAIPTTIPGTATAVLGIGVKLCITPSGTAGATDYFEVGKAKLEARLGTSVGPTPYVSLPTADEYARELARYFQISENGAAGTPIYATGQATTTNGFNVMVPFQTTMRITPVVSPITIGGLKVNAAGTLQTVSVLNTTGVGQTPHTGALSGTSTITAGQGTTLVGTGVGTGALGFSAEP